MKLGGDFRLPQIRDVNLQDHPRKCITAYRNFTWHILEECTLKTTASTLSANDIEQGAISTNSCHKTINISPDRQFGVAPISDERTRVNRTKTHILRKRTVHHNQQQKTPKFASNSSWAAKVSRSIFLAPTTENEAYSKVSNHPHAAPQQTNLHQIIGWVGEEHTLPLKITSFLAVHMNNEMGGSIHSTT